ncbi:MAG: TIGR01777 family oxidoreductase [Bacteroidales bacterium]|jgi:uncharacterized protein (TIGR01777 family)|nr:TIGR01777 family oxidoreductase [Bacteroidales bacterium]
MGKNILITGGTGLVGTAIKDLLISKGYNVGILSRQKKISGIKSFNWDYEKEILDAEAIEFADVIIHLAGENISSKRWTAKQKKRIIDSRVKTTELLYSAVQKSDKKPSKIISASAIGYYGSQTNDHIFTEEDGPGNDFLARTVVEWENAVDKFSGLGIETSMLRLGVVMSLKGGALPEMLKPLKFRFAMPLGSGGQFVPWIALEDLARMFLFVIEKNDAATIYNAVNPQQINNRQLMKYLAKKQHRWFIPIGIPAFIFKIIFGEMAVILLEGSRVSAKKIEKDGFQFNKNEIL